MQHNKLICGCFCECCSFSIFPLTKQIKRNYFNVLKNETKQLLKQTNWINQVANPFDLKIMKKKLEYIKDILNHELLECRCERFILLQKLEQAASYLITNEPNKTHPLRKLKDAFAELTYEDLNDWEKSIYINLMNNSDINYYIPIEEYELEYCNDSDYSLIIDEKYD
jgi:hypothetical protein